MQMQDQIFLVSLGIIGSSRMYGSFMMYFLL